ncbi:type II toxin-antitoxin system RelE family toxin [Phascolarctobacterium sp.]
MSYSVEYATSVYKSLKKIDKPTRLLILNWIEKNLVGCENPRQHGKPLIGNNAGVWRYRVGNYRILADILDDKLIIQVIKIGHRKSVYL